MKIEEEKIDLEKDINLAASEYLEPEAKPQEYGAPFDISEIIRKELAACIPNLLQSLLAEPIRQSNCSTVHAGYTCGLCSVTPIVGFRYFCTICKISVCEACEPSHECNMIKYKEAPAPEDPKETAIKKVQEITGVTHRSRIETALDA